MELSYDLPLAVFAKSEGDTWHPLYADLKEINKNDFLSGTGKVQGGKLNNPASHREETGASGTQSKSPDNSPVTSALNWYVPAFTILFLG